MIIELSLPLFVFGVVGWVFFCFFILRSFFSSNISENTSFLNKMWGAPPTKKGLASRIAQVVPTKKSHVEE